MKFYWCTINVKNLEESLKFYQEIVGLSTDKRFKVGSTTEIVLLGDEETKVELIYDEANTAVNIGEDIFLGFETDSLDRMVEPGISLVENVQEAVRFAREINDCLYGILSKNPERLGGFATLPMQSPEDAAKELERTVEKLGFKGSLINGHQNGVYLNDD